MNFDIADPETSMDYELDHETNCQWLPGDILPHTEDRSDLRAHTPQSTLRSEIRDLFQEMESKIDAALSDISNKLSHVESWVKAIEEKPLTSSPNSSSRESSTDCKRKRRSPPELQVIFFVFYSMCLLRSTLQFQIRTVHSSLRDENKFHCHDRYNGPLL